MIVGGLGFSLWGICAAGIDVLMGCFAGVSWIVRCVGEMLLSAWFWWFGPFSSDRSMRD